MMKLNPIEFDKHLNALTIKFADYCEENNCEYIDTVGLVTALACRIAAYGKLIGYEGVADAMSKSIPGGTDIYLKIAEKNKAKAN